MLLFSNPQLSEISRDDLLFFSSMAEFEQYRKDQHKDYLKPLTLKQAFDRGVQVFGNLLEG